MLPASKCRHISMVKSGICGLTLLRFSYTIINMKNQYIAGCDCTLISTASNLYYVSGYQNADAMILLFPDEKVYITDPRYTEEAGQAVRGFSVINFDKSLIETAIFLMKKRNCKNIGIEFSICYSDAQALMNEGFFLTDISGALALERSIKMPHEIERIKRAQEITDKTFSDILHEIKEGITERELAGILEGMLYKNGADGLAFSSIVAFGENISKPHAKRSQRRLKKSDFVLLDFGAMYEGYCSDMTRTVCFGTPSSEMKDIYDLVLTAQKNAIDNIGTGMRCDEAYYLAESVFKEKNLHEYFIHSLGHSLGIDIHEDISLSYRKKDVLQPNMVITVEPGLYFPGKFGVRIEDMIILDESGIDNLTKSPKNLIII